MTISWKRSMQTLLSRCLILFLTLLLSLDITEGRQILEPDLNVDNAASIFSSTQTIIAVCVPALVFLIVLVVVIFKCGDCYNSEVSSEFHPATSGSGRKWGGAAGYTSNQTSGGGITFGETVDPNSGQGLPYSMIPTNIPESGGFAGYNTGGQSSGDGGTTTTSTPLMGYQNFSTASASAPGGEGGPRHYNPALEQDQPPPPSYNESLRHASLRGNR